MSNPPEQPHRGSPESEPVSTATPAVKHPELAANEVTDVFRRRSVEQDRAPSSIVSTDEVRQILEEKSRTWGPERSETLGDLVTAVAEDMSRFNFSGAVEQLRAAGFAVPPHELFALAGDRALASGGASTAFEAYSLAGDVARLETLRTRLGHAPNLLRRLHQRLEELTPTAEKVGRSNEAALRRMDTTDDDGRSAATVLRATKQQQELAALLETADNRSSEQRDATRRALRNTDSILDHLLQDALRQAGTYELYAGLSETARRLAAKTRTFDR